MKVGQAPVLTPGQVESYLMANKRNAASLIAAFRVNYDKAFLHEAMEKYPNDPFVASAALFDGGLAPDERRQWLEAFKGSAPDNALANYLSASDYFKSGQIDQAVQEIMAAAEKPGLQNYWIDSAQNREEAYRTAGYTPAEAATAGLQERVPRLVELRQLDGNLVNLVNSYRQTGDETSAQAVMQMGLNLGQRLETRSGQNTLAANAVGLQIQDQMLGMMDVNSPYGASGQTVQDKLNQIAGQRAAIKAMVQQEPGILQSMSNDDAINYSDRMKAFGGYQALQWLVSKYGRQ